MPVEEGIRVFWLERGLDILQFLEWELEVIDFELIVGGAKVVFFFPLLVVIEPVVGLIDLVLDVVKEGRRIELTDGSEFELEILE